MGNLYYDYLLVLFCVAMSRLGCVVVFCFVFLFFFFSKIFLSHVQVLCPMSLACCLKYPYSCLSFHLFPVFFFWGGGLFYFFFFFTYIANTVIGC